MSWTPPELERSALRSRSGCSTSGATVRERAVGRRPAGGLGAVFSSTFSVPGGSDSGPKSENHLSSAASVAREREYRWINGGTACGAFNSEFSPWALAAHSSPRVRAAVAEAAAGIHARNTGRSSLRVVLRTPVTSKTAGILATSGRDLPSREATSSFLALPTLQGDHRPEM